LNPSELHALGLRRFGRYSGRRTGRNRRIASCLHSVIGIKPAGVDKEMKFFVYFDAYGHARQVVSEEELAQRYGNDVNKFLQAACRTRPDAAMGRAGGHVGTLAFASEEELREYLESLGDEITGFYGGDADSRPYNF
jgi:hypothetical protein